MAVLRPAGPGFLIEHRSSYVSHSLASYMLKPHSNRLSNNYCFQGRDRTIFLLQGNGEFSKNKIYKNAPFPYPLHPVLPFLYGVLVTPP